MDGKGFNQASRKTTYGIVIVALMTALAVILSFIPGFPIIPAVSFIKYEYSDIPIIIAALALGAPKGVLVALLSVGVSLLLGQEGGGPWGALQHFIAIGANAFAAGLIYRFRKTKKGAVLALSSGIILRTLLMIPANILIIPLYTPASAEMVKGLLLPGVIPVNFLKGLISAVVTFLVYKRVSRYLR
ncbi:MAG: ECF transporter S component [Clostridiales bacterium]|nr:ECF transporter S component [Clostridiales bacterium]